MARKSAASSAPKCPDCGERHRPERCRRHQGWKNYETWAVALWLDNERGSHEYWRERAAEFVRSNAHSTKHDASSYSDATIALSRELKNEIDGGAPDLEASLYSDLMNAALQEVEWRDIAAHYIDGAVEEATHNSRRGR